MAENPLAVVPEKPPTFRVRRVVHSDPDGVAAELEQAETDGYRLEGPIAQANGDLLLIFRHEGG